MEETQREAPTGGAVRRRPCVWALASGKGGVGKSVVTSSLAIAFARRGLRCALLDLDLGGANLHTLLGMPRLRPNLSDFMRRETASLADTLGPTGIPNLWLASADRSAHDAANPAHAVKQKLIRHIARLDVDHVFLDLGAGSSFPVMDFFLAADHGIVVVTPEPTSIENTYHFLKASFFRSLRRASRDPRFAESLRSALASLPGSGVRAPAELLRRVHELDPDAGRILEGRMRRFRPMLLVNQARDHRQRALGERLAREGRTFLGAEIALVGALAADETVRLAVAKGEPVLRLYPGCPFAADVAALAEALGARAGGHRERRATASAPAPARPARPPRVEATVDPGAPGAALRRRREELGLPLHELVAATRIRCIEALEGERFEALPSPVHVRHFVDQYARALGIANRGPLVERYLERYRAAGAGAAA